MTTIARTDVEPLGEDLLAEFDRLTAVPIVWQDASVMLVHDMVRHAPNLLLALAERRMIPLSEKEALHALITLGGVLAVKALPVAKVEQVKLSESAALMRIVLAKRSRNAARKST